MIADAKALEAAGAFSLILEAVPADLAQTITEAISIPTIGIGAGPHCDGQVLVLYDLLGLFDDFLPKVRQALRPPEGRCPTSPPPLQGGGRVRQVPHGF